MLWQYAGSGGQPISGGRIVGQYSYISAIPYAVAAGWVDDVRIKLPLMQHALVQIAGASHGPKAMATTQPKWLRPGVFALRFVYQNAPALLARWHTGRCQIATSIYQYSLCSSLQQIIRHLLCYVAFGNAAKIEPGSGMQFFYRIALRQQLPMLPGAGVAGLLHHTIGRPLLAAPHLPPQYTQGANGYIKSTPTALLQHLAML